jgi:hypothetical protein
MKTYNGHRSWNAWNVSLWILNDAQIYTFALECIAEARKTSRGGDKRRILNGATRRFISNYYDQKTPDGAKFNALSVRLCLEGLLED